MSLTGLIPTDVSLNAVTMGGTAHTYFSYAPFVSDGYLSFPGSSLTSTFDFGYQKQITLNGTVSIGCAPLALLSAMKLSLAAAGVAGESPMLSK